MSIGFQNLMMPFDFVSRTSLKDVDLIRSMCEEEYSKIKSVGELSLRSVERWGSEEVFNSRLPEIQKIAFIKCFSINNNNTICYWKDHKPEQIIAAFPHFGLGCIDMCKGVRLFDSLGNMIHTIAFEHCPSKDYSTGIFSSAIFSPILKRVEYEKNGGKRGIARDESKLLIDGVAHTDYFSAFSKVKSCYSDQEECRLVLVMRATHPIDIPDIAEIRITLKTNYLDKIDTLLI